ncbi:hypothetical protein CHS0354_028578, partial [Potamilus streckersoni]
WSSAVSGYLAWRIRAPDQTGIMDVFYPSSIKQSPWPDQHYGRPISVVNQPEPLARPALWTSHIPHQSTRAPGQTSIMEVSYPSSIKQSPWPDQHYGRPISLINQPEPLVRPALWKSHIPHQSTRAPGQTSIMEVSYPSSIKQSPWPDQHYGRPISLINQPEPLVRPALWKSHIPRQSNSAPGQTSIMEVSYPSSIKQCSWSDQHYGSLISLVNQPEPLVRPALRTSHIRRQSTRAPGQTSIMDVPYPSSINQSPWPDQHYGSLISLINQPEPLVRPALWKSHIPRQSNRASGQTSIMDVSHIPRQSTIVHESPGHST